MTYLVRLTPTGFGQGDNSGGSTLGVFYGYGFGMYTDPGGGQAPTGDRKDLNMCYGAGDGGGGEKINTN